MLETKNYKITVIEKDKVCIESKCLMMQVDLHNDKIVVVDFMNMGNFKLSAYEHSLSIFRGVLNNPDTIKEINVKVDDMLLEEKKRRAERDSDQPSNSNYHNYGRRYPSRHTNWGSELTLTPTPRVVDEVADTPQSRCEPTVDFHVD
jgi:hypothetical protein